VSIPENLKSIRPKFHNIFEGNYFLIFLRRKGTLRRSEKRGYNTTGILLGLRSYPPHFEIPKARLEEPAPSRWKPNPFDSRRFKGHSIQISNSQNHKLTNSQTHKPTNNKTFDDSPSSPYSCNLQHGHSLIQQSATHHPHSITQPFLRT
jgi:hypothetical protein